MHPSLCLTLIFADLFRKELYLFTCLFASVILFPLQLLCYLLLKLACLLVISLHFFFHAFVQSKNFLQFELIFFVVFAKLYVSVCYFYHHILEIFEKGVLCIFLKSSKLCFEGRTIL